MIIYFRLIGWFLMLRLRDRVGANEEVYVCWLEGGSGIRRGWALFYRYDWAGGSRYLGKNARLARTAIRESLVFIRTEILEQMSVVPF